MAKRDVVINLTANDKATPTITAASRSAKALRGEIDRLRKAGLDSEQIRRKLVQTDRAAASQSAVLRGGSSGKGGGALRRLAAEQVRGIGSGVAGGLIGLEAARRAAEEFAEAIEKAATGSGRLSENLADAAAESLKSIPIAGQLGHLIALTNESYRERTKYIRETAELEARVAAQARNAGRARSAEQSLAAQLRERVRAGEEELTIQRTLSAERRLELEQRRDLLAIDRELAALREKIEVTFANPAERAAQLRAAEEAAELQRGLVREAGEQQRARGAQLQDEAIQDRQRRLNELRALGREQDLRDAGMIEEAEIAAIERQRDERIGMIREEAEAEQELSSARREEIRRLADEEIELTRRLTRQNIERIREEAEERRRAAAEEMAEEARTVQREVLERSRAGVTTVESRFLTRDIGQGGIDEQRKTADNTKSMVEVGKRTVSIMERVERQLDSIARGGSIVVHEAV